MFPFLYCLDFCAVVVSPLKKDNTFEPFYSERPFEISVESEGHIKLIPLSC